MFWNNIKCLCIHIIVNLISFWLYYKFNLAVGISEWATPEAYNAHVNKMILISVVIICFAQVLYFIGGRLLLRNQGRWTKNLLSTSAVAVIGIVWWIILFPVTELEAFSHSNLWHVYAVYVSYMLSLIENLEKDIPLILLLSSIIPSMVMAAGIKKVKHIES